MGNAHHKKEEKHLEWLVLPDDKSARYTNHGDNRPGDVSELVTIINGFPLLNTGKTDWRLPTIEELKSLVGARHAPKDDWFWSSSRCDGRSDSAWGIDFPAGHVSCGSKFSHNRVCLVRG